MSTSLPDEIAVSVTDVDIASGVACHTGLCPIARRLKAMHPDYCVEVGEDFIRLTLIRNNILDHSKKRTYAAPPPEAKLFIRRFDRQSGVEPFEFLLRDPSDALSEVQAEV